MYMVDICDMRMIKVGRVGNGVGRVGKWWVEWGFSRCMVQPVRMFGESVVAPRCAMQHNCASTTSGSFVYLHAQS